MPQPVQQQKPVMPQPVQKPGMPLPVSPGGDDKTVKKA
jgi:hypothetical protein